MFYINIVKPLHLTLGNPLHLSFVKENFEPCLQVFILREDFKSSTRALLKARMASHSAG